MAIALPVYDSTGAIISLSNHISALFYKAFWFYLEVRIAHAYIATDMGFVCFY